MLIAIMIKKMKKIKEEDQLRNLVSEFQHMSPFLNVYSIYSLCFQFSRL